MKKVVVLIAASAILFSCAYGASGRLSGTRSLSTTEWGYQVTKGSARAGTQAQRFEVRPGDCATQPNWSDCATDRERSEITLDRKWPYGTDQWIGFSVYLPQDFKTSTRVGTTVGQIHQYDKGAGPSNTDKGYRGFPPLMQLEMLDNRYFLRVHVLSGEKHNVRDTPRDYTLAKISEMRGKWTDIIIHFDTSGDNEVLAMFVNGQKRAEISNWIKFIPSKYTFKYGLYRSFVSRHGGPMPKQVLYIDEVRMGSSFESVQVNEASPVD
jgi:hypothetical protein